MKNIIEYLITLVIALAYFLYIDARAGSVFLAVLIISPIISIAITLAAVKKVSVSIDCTASVLNKNNDVNFNAVLNKMGFFPTPFIVIKLFNSEHFSTEQLDEYKVILSSNKPETITQQYISRIWGVGEVGIEEIYMTDFLGLKTFYIYRENGEKAYTRQFEIYPNIPDYSEDNELIKIMCDEVAYSDNEETEEARVSINGLPGYEHRKYIPGDPLKKINWKLSFKKDELMVRIDEASILTKINVVIDYLHSDYYNYGKINSLLDEEKVVEATLMILQNIIKLNLECNVYYYTDEGWNCSTVKTINDVYSLQYTFCKLKFKVQANNGPRVPISQIKENGGCSTIIFFSCDSDDSLMNEINYCNQNGLNTQTVVAKSSRNALDNMWIIGNNYEIRKLT